MSDKLITYDKDSSVEELMQVLENRINEITTRLEDIRMYVAQGIYGVEISEIQREYIIGQPRIMTGFIIDGLDSMKTIIEWVKNKIKEETNE